MQRGFMKSVTDGEDALGGDYIRSIKRRSGLPALNADAQDLKLLIGAADAGREAGRNRKLADRHRGKKAKARKAQRTAKASRKRNRT